MKQSKQFCLVLVLLLLCIGLVSSPALAEQEEYTQEHDPAWLVLPLEVLANGELAIQVHCNGTEGLALLDGERENSVVLSAGFVTQTGVNTREQQKLVSPSLQLLNGQLEIHNLPEASRINWSRAQLSTEEFQLLGIIGRDVLESLGARIDAVEQRLLLPSPVEVISPLQHNERVY